MGSTYGVPQDLVLPMLLYSLVKLLKLWSKDGFIQLRLQEMDSTLLFEKQVSVIAIAIFLKKTSPSEDRV